MTWEVAVAGTVTLDDVSTPHGRRREQLGGSAVYFALAASRYAPVVVTGVVGADGAASARRALNRPNLRLDGLEVAAAPTFRWRAVHDFGSWIAVDEEVVPGAYAAWDPRLRPAAARAPVLFCGSMDPRQQRAVLDQASPRLCGVDSMRVFISAALPDVLDAARRADILFCDRAELAALTSSSTGDWRAAARSLCGLGRLRGVVVKGGPEGAACVTAVAVHELPAGSVEEVVDPTGAGDALAGGFLGACARDERDDEGHWPIALEEGMRCAAAAIGRFGLAGLGDVTPPLSPPSD